MWSGLQTVPSLERCPLCRVSFIERFHCIGKHTAPLILFITAVIQQY